MLRLIKIFLLMILIFVFCETIIRPQISFNGIEPDFLIIAIVIIALVFGSFTATVSGFLLGLIVDLAVPELLGLQALCGAVIGYSVGKLKGRLIQDSAFVGGALVCFAALLYDFIYLVIGSFVIDKAILKPLFVQIIPSALYSGLLSMPLIGISMLLGFFKSEE